MKNNDAIKKNAGNLYLLAWEVSHNNSYGGGGQVAIPRAVPTVYSQSFSKQTRRHIQSFAHSFIESTNISRAPTVCVPRAACASGNTLTSETRSLHGASSPVG